MSLQRGINLRGLAEKMGQCSGAEVRGICTEAGAFTFFLAMHNTVSLKYSLLAGMYALRERRQHVTQEDFEFAVAKVRLFFLFRGCCAVLVSFVCSRILSHSMHVWIMLTVLDSRCIGAQEEPRGKYFRQQTVLLEIV
jgi:hypothetical protein